MRIAIYHNLNSGGAKRVAAAHARYLGVHHQVHTYCPATADHAFAEDDSAGGKEGAPQRTIVPLTRRSYWGSPFGRLNPLVRLGNVRTLEHLNRALAENLDAGGYDVVLVHPCQETQAPSLLRYLATSAVYYCHELPRSVYERPEGAQGSSALRRALDRIDPLPRLVRRRMQLLDAANARAASSVVVNALTTATRVREAYGIEATHCSPGIETAVAAKTDWHERTFVLSVGALAPHKGFGFLIEAMALLPPHLRLPLVVVSNYQESAELARLQALAARLGVEAQFHCAISDVALERLYLSAALFAYAPVQEPLGLVTLEAMARALPVVAVAEGGLLETVQDEVTGLLAPRDAASMAGAMQRLLKDDALARRLATQGRACVAGEWSWSVRIALLEGVLAAAAQSGAARSPAHSRATGLRMVQA